MKTRNLLMVALLASQLLSGLTALAESTGGGNGGDVFICKNSNDNMVLDYYEGIDKGMFDSFGDPRLSVEENFNLWIETLAKTDVARAVEYKERGLKIIKDIKKVETIGGMGELVSFTNADLVDIPDSLELIAPKNCEKKQLVIQTNQERGEKLLKIQRQLWGQINNVQKAVIIAHEVVYEEFLKNKATDSRNARYFNQMVISGEINYFKLCDYFKFIGDLKLRSVFVGNYRDGQYNGYTFSPGNKCEENKIDYEWKPFLWLPTSRAMISVKEVEVVDGTAGANNEILRVTRSNLKFDGVGVVSEVSTRIYNDRAVSLIFQKFEEAGVEVPKKFKEANIVELHLTSQSSIDLTQQEVRGMYTLNEVKFYLFGYGFLGHEIPFSKSLRANVHVNRFTRELEKIEVIQVENN